MKTIYMLIKQLDNDTEVIFASENKQLLKEQLEKHVREHIETYFADIDDDYGNAIKQELLNDLNRNNEFWTDKDEVNELKYFIEETHLVTREDFKDTSDTTETLTDDDPFLDTTLVQLLSERTRRILHHEGIKTVRDLAALPNEKLFDIPGLGRKSIYAILAIRDRAYILQSEKGREGPWPYTIPPGTPISELDLSIRTRNALRAEGIISFRELTDSTEKKLRTIRGLSIIGLNEIKTLISKSKQK